MKILVCLSVVPDTTTNIRFNAGMDALDTTGIQWIINPWDELALTRMLEIREQPGSGVDNITVIHVGPKESDPVIQKALAVGADAACRVNALPAGSSDVAREVARFVGQQPFDLVVAGLDSADYNGSATGGMIAEMLGWSSFSSVSSVDIEGTGVTLEREVGAKKETIRVTVPCVITIMKGIARDPRIPSLRGIMTARTKPLTVLEPVGGHSAVRFVRFENPAPRPKVRLVDPAAMDELAGLLKNESKVL